MQKKNYHIEFEKYLQTLKNQNLRPKLLLHSCCAPCSSYVLEYLYPYFEITVFYYNPNLYPESEYEIRYNEQVKFCAEFSKNVVIPEGYDEIKVVTRKFDPSSFYSKIKGHEQDREGGDRCSLCFDLRLTESFKMANELNIGLVTTTLTISPLKQAQVLNELGTLISSKFLKIHYLETNFKKKGGFLRSTELSKEYLLYRQNYCGCVYSYQEMKKRLENQ